MRKEAEKCAMGSGGEVARGECKIWVRRFWFFGFFFLVSSEDFHGQYHFLSYFFFPVS